MTLDASWWLANQQAHFDAATRHVTAASRNRPWNAGLLGMSWAYRPRLAIRHVPFPTIPPNRCALFPWTNLLGADGIRVYLTGATSDGGSQADPDDSLGDYRSSTEADRVGRLLVSPVNGIQVVQASRWNGALGVVGSLFTVTSSRIRYAAPGSTTAGPSTRILPGETKTLYDASDRSKWVRIYRTDSTPLAGSGNIEFVDQYNNVFGMLDAANAESTGGGDRYRAVMLRHDDVIEITALKIWIEPLPFGSTAVSSAAQLPGSGAGSITGATGAFCGWPARGWARIETSGGTLREIVYYSSRTDESLTVPALGRGRMGSSAAAGGATDNCYPVPGIRIADESANPLVDGPIQTIADEETAPTGVTWSTARTAATGLQIGTLRKREQVGLWIHRELPAGISATPSAWNYVRLSFVSGGRTYYETLAGLYRIAVDALARYELHVGIDAPPDLSAAPDETFTTLPHTTSLALSPGTVNYLVTNRRNKYDLVSQVMEGTVIAVDGSGDETVTPPTAPEIQDFAPASGGTLRLRAIYHHGQDDDSTKADQWNIYIRYNGTNPDPSLDTPVTVALVAADVVASLDWTSPAQTNGTVAKVLVRVERTDDNVESASSAIATATAETAGPSTPDGSAFFRGVAEANE